MTDDRTYCMDCGIWLEGDGTYILRIEDDWQAELQMTSTGDWAFS